MFFFVRLISDRLSEKILVLIPFAARRPITYVMEGRLSFPNPSLCSFSPSTQTSRKMQMYFFNLTFAVYISHLLYFREYDSAFS